MISVKNVSKSFGSIRAVNYLCFEINTGEVVGFLGPNGAGKSTTMRMITGFFAPNAGTITIDGVDVTENPVAVQKKIGYLPESAALYLDMTAVDFLKFLGTFRGLSKTQLSHRLRIVTQQCQLEKVLGRKIGDLSKGYRQRVGLAQALLHDPEVLILDEPTIGLDPNQIIEIRNLIQEIGKTKTIFLSTHILSEVEAVCGRVIIISQGKIVAQGAPRTLTASSSKAATYTAVVRGDIGLIEIELKKMPDVASVIAEQKGDGLVDVKITSASAGDLSETIFDLAVQNNWRLSRLNREQQTLEDVFKQLTQ